MAVQQKLLEYSNVFCNTQVFGVELSNSMQIYLARPSILIFHSDIVLPLVHNSINALMHMHVALKCNINRPRQTKLKTQLLSVH